MAVVDRREIEFDIPALVRVIASSLRAAQGFGLPGVPPTGVRCRPSEGELEILYGAGRTTQAVRIAAEAVGALLVAYCIRSRIPMPRQADKAIRIESHCVVLAFRVEYSDAPAAEVVDGSTRTPVSIKAWTWVEPGGVPSKK
jgi:hypothetical protein